MTFVDLALLRAGFHRPFPAGSLFILTTWGECRQKMSNQCGLLQVLCEVEGRREPQTCISPLVPVLPATKLHPALGPAKNEFGERRGRRRKKRTNFLPTRWVGSGSGWVAGLATEQKEGMLYSQRKPSVPQERLNLNEGKASLSFGRLQIGMQK